MAYYTKLKTDVNGKPIPQYYNQATREYEALEGNNGATRHILYGPTGDPITIVDNKMAVRATDLEDKVEGIIDGTTPATVQLSGSILAKDPTTGDPVELTAIQDNNGDWVLRMVDAAPYAYDEVLDSLQTHSSFDLRGLSTNKPLATAVDVGTTYWSIDTDPHAELIEVSDGTQWVVM